MRSAFNLFVLLILANPFCSPAQSQIFGTTGNVEIVNAPASVRRNDFENTLLARVFLESEDVPVGSLLINAVTPGVYDEYTDFQDITFNNPPAFASYFLHFDPIGTQSGTVFGSITFETPMLGVIGRSLTLEETDNIIGHPGTLYPTDRFDREPEYRPRGTFDQFTISSDMKTLSFQLTATDIDQIRIITAANVPEPSITCLLAFGLAGVSSRRSRRRSG